MFDLARIRWATRLSVQLALTVLIAVGTAGTADASTLVRLGVPELVTANELAVHGHVTEIHSHWNSDRSMIVTDVRLAPLEVLKGASIGDVVFTLVGGTVDGITTVLVSGADLETGGEYVLFLERGELPGLGSVLTVPDHAQAVFSVAKDNVDGASLAISQAATEPMLAGATGLTEAPGGEAGLALNALLSMIRAETLGK